MIINILTLFPDMFTGPLSESIMKRAVAMEKVTFNIINIRDFTTDSHHTADQPPYGGGAGMVMMVEPIDRALQHVQEASSTPQEKKRTILMAAKGNLFTQQRATELSALEEITLICGHYEGVDERVREHLVDEEIRVGDYVLTGGELPAMIIADALTRLLPGVLGDEMSNVDESHSTPGYLEYPHYTRPANYNGWQVPEVLLNGNHALIQAWRDEQSTQAT